MYGTGIARTLELSCCALLPKYVFYISICTYPLDNGENQKIQPDFNIKTQSYVYLYIQCIIQSRDRKHDYLLTLQILDIQVLKKKESGAHRLSRVKCTVQAQIKSNLNFLAAISLKCSFFNREIKLPWCFKSVDRQNRSMMPLSC